MKNSKILLRVNEQGSAAIFVVFLLPIMFTMIVLVIAIGQLVIERIKLQTTVDVCALAAAVQQSIGLNEIADLNRSANIEYNKAKAMLGGVPWYDRSHASHAFNFHKKVLDSINSYRIHANYEFARRAEIYAQNTKTQNLPNTYLFSIAPAEQRVKLMHEGPREIKSVSYSYYATSCSGKDCYPVAPTKNYRWPGDPSHIGAHITYWPSLSYRRNPVPVTREMTVRWRKMTPPMTYAAYGLSQEIKPFVLGNGLFDMTRGSLLKTIPDNYKQYINRFKVAVTMPRMVAYAAAKPNRGAVFKGESIYSPILYQLKRLRPLPYVPIDYSKIEH